MGGCAILLLAILILAVFMYNKVGKEGFFNDDVLPPVEKNYIFTKYCGKTKVKNERDKCMQKNIDSVKRTNKVVDKIIKKSDLLNICKTYNLQITNLDSCLIKYKEKNSINDAHIIDEIIKKSDLLKICKTYKPQIIDLDQCFFKYIEKNKINNNVYINDE